jgi:1-deoxy-D-xylulose 5-phosphate reductoisomerase
MAFLNAVDEEVIKYFVSKKISYLDMISIINDLVENKMIYIPSPDEEDILRVDSKARQLVKEYIK